MWQQTWNPCQINEWSVLPGVGLPEIEVVSGGNDWFAVEYETDPGPPPGPYDYNWYAAPFIEIQSAEPGDGHVAVSLWWIGPGSGENWVGDGKNGKPPPEEILITYEDAPGLVAEKKWGWIAQTVLDVHMGDYNCDTNTWSDPAVDAESEEFIPNGLQHEMWVPRPEEDYNIQEVVADWVFADFHWGSTDPEDVQRHLAGHAIVNWWLIIDDEEGLNQDYLHDLMDTLEPGNDGWSAVGDYDPFPMTPKEIIDELAFGDVDGRGPQEAVHTEWKNPDCNVPYNMGDPGGYPGCPGIDSPDGPSLVGTYIRTETQDSYPWEYRGLALAELHNTAVEDVIIVTLVDYPIDKHGENPVAVEIGKKYFGPPPPPPVQVKIPQVRWAGEKIVLEKKWGEMYAGHWVSFQLEHPGLGTLEPVSEPPIEHEYPWGETGGGMTFGEIVYTVVGEDGVARAIIDSEDPGQADIKCVLFDEHLFGNSVTFETTGLPIALDLPMTVLSEHAFVVFYLKLEEVTLSWEQCQVEDDVANVDVQVAGWFTNQNLSTREAKIVDMDGDGVDDHVLPAGRWVLPYDWALLAGANWQIQRPWWDLMDGPGDGIVATLDPLGDYNTAVNSIDGKAEYPVIGPFSTLQPIAPHPDTGIPTWNATAVVPGDPWVNTTPGVWETSDVRTTVVPNGELNKYDAPMPTAEVTFTITSGDGSLDEKCKASLEDPGPWDVPYYEVEIPSHWAIPPLGYPSGYAWDSWDWDATNGDPEGPYPFWADLHLPPYPDDDQQVEVYSDNHGVAAVWVVGEDGPVTVTAVADYPYLGKHPAMLGEIIVWGEGRLEGDVNDDGNIDAGDALLIAKHIIGTVTLTGDDFLAADVNDDTFVDAADALLVAKYIVGTVTGFPGGIYIP
jgi:hypothetical protein